ncbi:MAG: hypothetical protein HWN67_13735 [Candidatus Helarchaeota archaeon]|nr:hypothetical protein [Candidatus Helarchaeota archaeon]
MKIGIVTDGKYGERAFENIKRIFPCDWILIEEVPSSQILDDYKLDIPDCDLYISYVRHPDQVFALAELGKPTLLGISFGSGFFKQVQEINPKVLAFPTMCSLEPNTGIFEIDTFAHFFGRPKFVCELDEKEKKIEKIEAIRSSPCGSSKVGPNFIKLKELNPTNLQDFAIHVCYECRAPRFGRTCDKELSGLIHIRALLESLKDKYDFKDETILKFIEEIEKEYNSRLEKR